MKIDYMTEVDYKVIQWTTQDSTGLHIGLAIYSGDYSRFHWTTYRTSDLYRGLLKIPLDYI